MEQNRRRNGTWGLGPERARDWAHFLVPSLSCAHAPVPLTPFCALTVGVDLAYHVLQLLLGHRLPQRLHHLAQLRYADRTTFVFVK